MMRAQTYPTSLTLALPKQEKIQTPIMKLLKEKGFEFEIEGDTGVLIDKAGNIPNIRVEFVRAADALLLMEKKAVDFAMIGSDVADEYTSGENPKFEKPDKKFDLQVAGCSFELAVPDADIQKYKNLANINGLRIATSYPNLTKEWLKKNNIEASEILVRDGGVESSIRMGLADVVTDLVDTRKTLRQNNLTSVFEITKTSAVCYVRKDADVLVDMRVNEVIRKLQSKDKIFIQPAVNDKEYAIA